MRPWLTTGLTGQQGCITDVGTILVRALPLEHGLLEQSKEPLGRPLELHPVILGLSQ
jgi:hypothetical protein